MTPTKEQLADPKWWDENAPEGATHWAPESVGFCECWYRPGDPTWFFAAEHTGWAWYRKIDPIHPARSAVLIERPMPAKITEWRGPHDGLPPVGALVRCDRYGDPVEVLYVSSKIAVVRSDFGAESALKPQDLRPIETPEQKAARERADAIDDIASMLGRGTFAEDAARVYDSGYRKHEMP